MRRLQRVSVGSEWLERSDYWFEQSQPPTSFHRSRKLRSPLTISGHGGRVYVNSGCLIVRHGFTHFPQKSEELRFFPNDAKRPERIILIDGSGAISFDALDWLARNNVPLIRLNWRGEVQIALGGNCIAIDPHRVIAQRNVTFERSIKIAAALISEKLKNSISTLNSILPRSKSRDEAIARIKAYWQRVKAVKPGTLSQIMGIEGAAAISYFGAWQSLPIKWEGTQRKPIPPDWHQIRLRSSVTREKIKNRNASHPVNAMLNYAYAVLESQIRIRIRINGYDPSIGFLHKSKRDNSALVFDLMEPMRPIVDQVVVAFIKSNVFTPDDFLIRPDGVCRLHPNLAAAIVTKIIKDQNLNRPLIQLKCLTCAS